MAESPKPAPPPPPLPPPARDTPTIAPRRSTTRNIAACLAVTLATLIVLGSLTLILALRFQSGPVDLTTAPEPSKSAPVVGLFVQPDDGRAPLLDELGAARATIDLAIYLLSDDETIQALETAVDRGLPVRVLLEEHPFGGDGRQADTFDRLQQAGIDVRWSNPAFRFSHIKTLIVDDAVAVIMNQNLTYSSFTQNRELDVITTRPDDVAQAVAIFQADWERAPEPAAGPLIVSPTNARSALLALIGSASSTLDVYAEVVREPAFVTGLSEAAARGVAVRVVMSPADDRQLVEVRQLVDAGIRIRFVSSPYIHAKLFLVDSERAFVGSQNMTATSLDQNRELGLVVDEPGAVERINRLFNDDFRQGRELSS